jgi:hypothetical protein
MRRATVDLLSDYLLLLSISLFASSSSPLVLTCCSRAPKQHVNTTGKSNTGENKKVVTMEIL